MVFSPIPSGCQVLLTSFLRPALWQLAIQLSQQSKPSLESCNVLMSALGVLGTMVGYGVNLVRKCDF